jgi:hypothetical protein
MLGIEDDVVVCRIFRVVAVLAHMRRAELDLVDRAGEQGMAGEPHAIPSFDIVCRHADPRGGLGCKRWRDLNCHCSLLDAGGGVERERPLDDLE